MAFGETTRVLGTDLITMRQILDIVTAYKFGVSLIVFLIVATNIWIWRSEVEIENCIAEGYRVCANSMSFIVGFLRPYLTDFISLFPSDANAEPDYFMMKLMVHFTMSFFAFIVAVAVAVFVRKLFLDRK